MGASSRYAANGHAPINNKNACNRNVGAMPDRAQIVAFWRHVVG